MTDLVILAAGLGKRFAGLPGDVPKVLLRVPSGRTLLAENLTSALSNGVASRAVVVTGHRAELIDQEVAAHESAGSIVTVHNPDYATFGPVRSLWAARETIERRDVMILNGDTYYRPDALAAISGRRRPGFHLLYSRRGVAHDDVKLTLVDGRIAAVGKGIPPGEAHGVSAGVFLIRGAAARAQFSSVLGRFVRDDHLDQRPTIWHDLVDELARAGRPLFAVEIGHGNWIEVDTPDDYAALRAALGVTSVGVPEGGDGP